MSIVLGSMCTDSITGFSGVATARTEFLYGCVRVCLEPKERTAEGKPIEAIWFDEQRLDAASEVKTGGPSGFATPFRRDSIR